MSKYYYEFERDSQYCYKNTNVLINKFGIKDSKTLYQLENDFTTLTISEILQEPITGNFTLEHLKKIHKAIFSDIYEWAGELRNVNISKGVEFCQYQYIETQFDSIYESLVKDNFLLDLHSKDEAIEKYAYYLGEINVIHPFREGNGRVQRVYLNYLSRISGYELDFSLQSKDTMIEACYKAFYGIYTPMEELIGSCISKIPSDKMLYYRELFSKHILE